MTGLFATRICIFYVRRDRRHFGLEWGRLAHVVQPPCGLQRWCIIALCVCVGAWHRGFGGVTRADSRIVLPVDLLAIVPQSIVLAAIMIPATAPSCGAKTVKPLPY